MSQEILLAYGFLMLAILRKDHHVHSVSPKTLVWLIVLWIKLLSLLLLSWWWWWWWWFWFLQGDRNATQVYLQLKLLSGPLGARWMSRCATKVPAKKCDNLGGHCWEGEQYQAMDPQQRLLQLGRRWSGAAWGSNRWSQNLPNHWISVCTSSILDVVRKFVSYIIVNLCNIYGPF